MNQLPNYSATPKGVFAAKSAFRVLFAFVWMQNTVMPFVTSFCSSVLMMGEVTTYILPVLTWILFLLSASYVIGCLRWVDILFPWGMIIMILLSLLFYPQNAEYIQPDLLKILAVALPMYIIGVCYDHEQLEKDIFWYSVASLLVMYIWQLIQLNRNVEITKDNMDASYNILPSILYLCYWAFKEKKKWLWIWPIFGVYMLLSYGSRGPIMVWIVYFAILSFIYIILKQKGAFRLWGTVVLVAIVITLLSTNVMTNFAMYLQERFSEIGLSTRIFDYFIEGDIADDNGRKLLADAAKQCIADNPILGTGFYGDRVAIDMGPGGYAHNLALELWCHFGVFIGTLFLILILSTTFGAVGKMNTEAQRNFLLLLICLVFVKLMVSYTYTKEPYFYFLLGVAASGHRKKGRRL